MREWIGPLVVLAFVAGAIGVIKYAASHRPLRDTFSLRFAVCEQALDLSFKCEPCFAGEREPLCPEDARVMMMWPK